MDMYEKYEREEKFINRLEIIEGFERTSDDDFQWSKVIQNEKCGATISVDMSKKRCSIDITVTHDATTHECIDMFYKALDVKRMVDARMKELK